MVQQHNRVGIVLAGGKGTRLYPLTKVVSKQLLPVYNKPVIYYPIETLIQTGHQQIIIITKPEDRDLFKELILSNKEWNCEFIFLVQEEPKGLPDAFNVARDYIDNKPSTLILGDNLINADLSKINFSLNHGAQIFLKKKYNSNQYGVLKMTKEKKIILLEKPKNSINETVVIGLYLFDSKVCYKVKKLKPSNRGELEIIDLIRMYANEESLNFFKLKKKDIWYDVGSFDNLLECSNYIKKSLNNHKI